VKPMLLVLGAAVLFVSTLVTPSLPKTDGGGGTTVAVRRFASRNSVL